jgi:hypothetical protein
MGAVMYAYACVANTHMLRVYVCEHDITAEGLRMAWLLQQRNMQCTGCSYSWLSGPASSSLRVGAAALSMHIGSSLNCDCIIFLLTAALLMQRSTCMCGASCQQRVRLGAFDFCMKLIRGDCDDN